MTLYRDQGHPHGNEMQKSKMAVSGGLTNSCEKKRSEKQRRKGKIFLNAEFQRIARRDKKAFLSDQCKEIENNNRMGKMRNLFVTSLVAQMVKCLHTMRETWVQSLGQEDLLEKGMATHSSILPGKFHGRRRLVGYSPWGRKESDMTERLHFQEISSRKLEI